MSSKTNLTQTHAISLKHTETDFQKVTHNMLLKLSFQCNKITYMWIFKRKKKKGRANLEITTSKKNACSM